jgi:G patch domain-containing protein 1
MADDSDEEDYIVYGTPLQDEELAGVGRQGKQDPAAVRSLPVHQQEATDDQGRRRFHGAFTGGFSAGYYNTVGSKVHITTVLAGRPQQKWGAALS